MFRTRKSDDSFIYRRPAGKPSERQTSSEESDGSVASSALRWLTGSDPSNEVVEDDESAAELDLTAEEEASDVLDLTNPLDAAETNDNDRSEAAEAPSNEKPAPNPAPPQQIDKVHAEDGVLSPLEFDDIDDLDDFDEIPLQHLIEKPLSSSVGDTRPSDRDRALPANHGRSIPPLPDMPATKAPVSSVEDKAVRTVESPQVPEPSERPPEPSPSAPLADVPRSDDVSSSRTKAAPLEEAPATSPETSLELRPIPELQTGARTRSKTETKRSTPPDADPAKGKVHPAPDPAPAPAVTPTSIRADDIIDTIPQDHADPADDGLDIEALELDLESSDDADDSVGDDWHAHLADVLGNDDEVSPPPPTEKSAAAEAPADTAGPPHKPVIRDRDDHPAPVVPLSRTLNELASSEEPAEEKAEIPAFPLLARKAPQKKAASPPSSALPAETTELSVVQMSLGIVANVPRLRRFAAAQIGDELLADRLVQTTMETALADPCSLQPVSDLGLALIKLLYRHRESMLTDPSAIDRSPEDSQTFEAALCQGLAGADQFEMHQFAAAISRLDERDREFLIMVNLENLSYDQIADIVQMPRERVMAMVSNARMRLRQALANDEAGSKDTSSAAIFTPHQQEIDIHGYLDGELDSGHMAEIDALVEHDEDAADRLVHYGIQGDLIRRLYAPLFNRPIPGSLLESLSTAARPARRGFRLGARRALIAGTVIVVLGFGAIGSGIAGALSGLLSDTPTISSSETIIP